MKRKLIVAFAVAACALCLCGLVACGPKSPTPTPTPDDPEHVHSYTSVVTDPKCVEQGYTTYTCSCSASYIADYTAALGHDVDGDRCKRCGHGATDGLAYSEVDGGYAVSGIGSVTSNDIIIPSTYGGSPVVAIADNSFTDNKTIEYVTLSTSVKTVGAEAFRNCEALKKIDLAAVEELGMLSLCAPMLNSVELPDTLKIIRNTAFSDLVMDELHIPASVELVEECAFSFCKFDKITVAQGNARYKADGNCLVDTQNGTLIYACKNSVLPNDGSVTKIGGYAFNGVTGLNAVVIPDSVTDINMYAFAWSDVKSVKLGKGVSKISTGIFLGCEELASLTVDPENATYTSVDNCVINKAKKSIVSGCKSSVIPTDATVATAIEANAFNECPLPKNLTIPSNIASIGSLAFASSGVENVTVCGNVTSADGAFNGCDTLEIVTIEQGVTSIPKGMFRSSGVRRVTFPESFETIGERAFSATSLTEISLPSKVTTISKQAFEKCYALTQVTIPDTVTTIGDSAFASCTNLVKVTIGINVTNIGSKAFDKCNKLTELVNLSALDIQKSETSSPSIFGNIGYSLASKKISSTSPECCFAGEIYTSADHTSKLDFVDGFVFYDNGGAWELYACGKVGDVTLPTSYNGNDYDIAAGAFVDFSCVTGVSVESGVNNVKQYAFIMNRSIKSVKITGATNVAQSAFYKCTKLTDVKFDNCGTVSDEAVGQ